MHIASCDENFSHANKSLLGSAADPLDRQLTRAAIHAAADFAGETLSRHLSPDIPFVGPAVETLSIDETLKERGDRYGEYNTHAFTTQRLKTIMKNHMGWGKLSDSQKESLEMVAHKIGRILNGDPNYLDSWHDIVGYVQLICDQLEGKRPK